MALYRQHVLGEKPEDKGGFVPLDSLGVSTRVSVQPKDANLGHPGVVKEEENEAVFGD